MCSFRLRRMIYLAVSLLFVFVGCSRSHVLVQFEGSMPYYGGIADVDAALERFNQTHSFEQVHVWVFYIADLQPTNAHGKPLLTWTLDERTFHYASYRLQRSIPTFYELELYEKGNYYRRRSEISRDDYTFEVKALNRKGVVERLIYGEIVGEVFVIFDAY